MVEPASPPGEDRPPRVVALLADRADAAMCRDTLGRHDIPCEACGDVAAFGKALDHETDVLLVDGEHLAGPAGEGLRRFLGAQPAWSALPVIVMYRALPAAALEVAQECSTLARVILLESPVRVASFVSAVQMALYDRRQQFRIRDLLDAAAAQVRQRDEFMALLGHELRNPLAAISTCVEVLKLGPGDGDQTANCLGIVGDQTAHMRRMLDDLLDISRLTRAKLSVRRDTVDLVAILRQCVTQAEWEFDGRHEDLRVRLPAEPLYLAGDATRLQQVFANLLNNAFRYSRAGETVTLSAARRGERVEVRVSDRGRGMDPAILERVFEPFYQAEHAAGRAGLKGLGLGLSLASKLVSLHGGTIRAVSEGVDRGCEMVVALPAGVPVQRAAGASPPAGGREIRPRRVLLVEDNRELALGLRTLLEERGHEVRVAFDGAGALAEVRDWAPEAAVIDIGLAGMDGYELSRRLRASANLAATRFVALTGYGSTEDRRRSLEAGFLRHLIKPASLDELEAAIAGPGPRD